MELKKLILKNFRSHRALTLEFAEGVTGICGDNGSGKSNIVEAIIFLLTGEGYGKTKQEMLKVGEASGYVIGHLMIDEKEAILERHIDTAKVNFKYDGKVYKKSSEVAELWDKLFQIDKNIVQNVVVSPQGEISLLFNGDNATKEKLFQKIFMVPNTTKLRDVIWNNYIKMAPPEYPVKDECELLSNLQVTEKLVELTEEKLNEINVDEEGYKSLIERQAFLKSVASSAANLKTYTANLESAQKLANTYTNEVNGLAAKMATIPIDEYHGACASAAANKPLFEKKQAAEAKRKALAEPNREWTEELKTEMNSASARYTSIEADVRSNSTKITSLKAKLKEYADKGLTSGTCPTCGTVLDDIEKLLTHTNAEIVELDKTNKELAEEVKNHKARYEELAAIESEWQTYNQKAKELDTEISLYAGVEYDAEEHELYGKVIQKYNEMNEQLKTADTNLEEAEKRVNSARIAIAGLAKYDKDSSEFDGEVDDVEQRITAAQGLRDQKQKLEVELATRKKEVEGYQKDYDENVEYLAKNEKRNKYVSVLNSVYEVFHTTKFPRSLIQTYASAVSDYMNSALQSFNFPYRAEVNESFGIDIYDDENRKLPAISGGQQVMIGFSLRLALHNMFVGAFPFMIIDEGSYGLAERATQKYFEIIASLNKISKFKQVIIIDHHKELENYVDHVITIEKAG